MTDSYIKYRNNHIRHLAVRALLLVFGTSELLGSRRDVKAKYIRVLRGQFMRKNQL